MRYPCLLLIAIAGLMFSTSSEAREIIRTPFCVDWPADGNYRIGFKEDFWLLNPKVTVFDAQHRLMYWAPADYTPPAGTLMHPMGGNHSVGNELKAMVESGDAAQLQGRVAGVVEILGKGRFFLSAFVLELRLIPTSGMICKYQFELLSQDNIWQWCQDGTNHPLKAPVRMDKLSGVDLISGGFMLSLSGNGDSFMMTLVPGDERLGVTVSASRPLTLIMTFEATQR